MGWIPLAPTKAYSHPLVTAKSIQPLKRITISDGRFQHAFQL
jgi:hypothetical protein